MHGLLQRVLAHIQRQELLQAGDRVGVAISGGIDSVALLRLLLDLRGELGIVVSVVHFNHKLRRAESDADEEFVAKLARDLRVECRADSGDVAAQAAEEHISVETAARQLRYGFFRHLLGEDFAADLAHKLPRLNKIATGHTLDDQAETVLMRLIRGTGMRGLGGIHSRIPVEREDAEPEYEDDHGEIIRPLLGIRRRELEKYLTVLKQPWREDSSNADVKFTRNRVRQILVPLLESEFNPAIADGLAELAEIARGEEDYWENEISGWLGTVVQWAPPAAAQIERESLIHIRPSPDQRTGSPCEDPQPFPPQSQESTDASISRTWLLTEPVAAQRRLVKAIGDHMGIPLEFRHIEEILRFAAENGPSGKRLALPRGWTVAREQEALVFRAPDPGRHKRMRDYQYRLPLPGRAIVPEASTVLEALRLPPKWQAAEYNPQQLLSAELLPAELTVRNWRPGDRFWPAQTKAPKKIKELLTQRHIAQAERELWPVALDGEQIVWMRGFPVPAKLRAQPEREAVLIRETPWAEEYAI